MDEKERVCSGRRRRTVFMGDKNRRKMFRVGAERPVIVVDDAGSAFAGGTSDMSSEGFGACFECAVGVPSPETGREYRFTLCLDSNRIIGGAAMAVHELDRESSDAVPGVREFGFLVVEFDAGSKAKLCSFIEECKNRLMERMAAGEPIPLVNGAPALREYSLDDEGMERFLSEMDTLLAPYRCS